MAAASLQSGPAHTHQPFARYVCGIMVLLAASVALPAFAQTPSRPDARRGKDLIERFCSSCHLMPEARGPVVIGVPTLNAIANEPNQTGDRIARSLLNPHPPMPNASLGRDEINDIVMYLNSLRRDQTKPLIEMSPDAPKYPKPS